MGKVLNLTLATPLPTSCLPFTQVSIQVGFRIGFPYYRLTTVPVNDSVYDSVSDTVTELVYYPFPYVFIEALEPHSIDRVLILFLQSVHGLSIDNKVYIVK